MFEDPLLQIFLSKDAGESFHPVTNYTETEMGFISGIATHPVNPATAYLLYSFKDDPKILRTTNYGDSWEDISGFGTDDSSANGFPDVMVHSLLVMPFDTNWIWAGTEVGLYESTDNGKTWSYADNGLPAVSVFDMKIIDHQIVIGTHGRGIWTLELNQLTDATFKQPDEISFNVYPNPSKDLVNISIDNSYRGEVNYRIYSTNGQLQKSGSFYKNASLLKKQISCHELKEGMYVLQLNFGNENVSKKLHVID
jgi:hypothetical protein